MKKILVYVFLILSFIVTPSLSYVNAMDNIRVTTENNGKVNNNWELEDMAANGDFFYVGTTGEKWLKLFILNIARDLRVMLFVLYLLIVVIMVIKLVFADNTDEKQKSLKMWILWSTVGIMVMQVAYSVYKVMFDRAPDANLARRFWEYIVQPFTDMLMMLASFAFIAMAIFAFYKIVTAGGNDEGIKKGKTTIFQAIIWFIVIKFADIIVTNTFNPDCWGGGLISYWGTNICENVKSNSLLIITLINWINSFLAIVIVIMIIYAWFLVLIGWWEEEKNKKAKRIILYSAIWLFILFASYMILTFFILPQSKI